MRTQAWPVSPRAAALQRSALVWDNVFPINLPAKNRQPGMHQRYDAGVDVVSITLAGDNHNISQALRLRLGPAAAAGARGSPGAARRVSDIELARSRRLGSSCTSKDALLRARPA